MKTNNKKKLVMITAMFLMIALVIGMGAMTYARYTTTKDTGAQSATAAKWGIVLTVNTDSLFKDEYDSTVDVDTDALDVSANSAVVAPGTSGEMTIAINGSAEVLSQLKITEVGTNEEIYFGNDYYPVKWTLTDKEDTLLVENKKLSDVISYLTTTVSGTKWNAGTSIDEVYTISWNWAIGAESSEVNQEDNQKDTAIGILAQGGDPAKTVNDVNTILGTTFDAATLFNCDISFQLKITVEQIQD
ncbi:MAG: hypothetical protein IJY69_02120 [Clostridia bacterium]|nr:hypothetical protein [Clostridia bacterium]